MSFYITREQLSIIKTISQGGPQLRDDVDGWAHLKVRNVDRRWGGHMICFELFPWWGRQWMRKNRPSICSLLILNCDSSLRFRDVFSSIILRRHMVRGIPISQVSVEPIELFLKAGAGADDELTHKVSRDCFIRFICCLAVSLKFNSLAIFVVAVDGVGLNF